jgi:prolyl-tRNA synthetase
MYADFAIEDGAIPVVKGEKANLKSLPVTIYSIKLMMGDTRALQAGTSHTWAKILPKPSDIQYLDQSNLLQYVDYLLGSFHSLRWAIIMTHGDEQTYPASKTCYFPDSYRSNIQE